MLKWIMLFKKYISLIFHQFDRLNSYWLGFLFFSFSNAFIAYGKWSMETNLFIVFYGIFLPSIFFIYGQTRKNLSRAEVNNELSIRDNKRSDDPPVFLWIFFGLLFLVIRFYKLESIPFWPVKEDGFFAINGMDLSRKWHWQVLWGECQSEPLILWMFCIYFKFIEPSFFSLRFFSAFLSILTVLLGYWAARQFFTKSFSFLFSFFVAFGFWSFLYSRISIDAITVFPLEFAAFGWLGVSLNRLKTTSSFKILDILILGFLSGLGFYTYTVWPVVFLSILLVVIFKAVESFKNFKFILFYCLIVLITAFPVILARLSQGGLTHVQDELNGFSAQRLTGLMRDYLVMFFWNGLKSGPDGPVWGGIFNPIDGALIFLGFLKLGVNFKSKISQWFFLSGCLFVLPGILGNVLGMCHVSQTLPLLSLALVFGLEALAVGISKDFRWYGIGLLLVIASVLNIYHWFGPFQDWKSLPSGEDSTPVEYANAYHVLFGISRQSGPLYVFSDFNSDSFNKTLKVTDYPFDALQNPKLYPSKPVWSALIINKYYVPFLKKRYPLSQWMLLKKDDIRYHSNLVLGLIPTHSMSSQELISWRRADRVCSDISLQINTETPPIYWERFKNSFLTSAQVFETDPFLHSVFLEKIAYIDISGSKYNTATQEFEDSTRLGYPTVMHYLDVEMLLRRNGQIKESQKFHQKAVEAQRNYSTFEPNL